VHEALAEEVLPRALLKLRVARLKAHVSPFSA
jgi:hypothetical protein